MQMFSYIFFNPILYNSSFARLLYTCVCVSVCVYSHAQDSQYERCTDVVRIFMKTKTLQVHPEETTTFFGL